MHIISLFFQIQIDEFDYFQNQLQYSNNDNYKCCSLSGNCFATLVFLKSYMVHMVLKLIFYDCAFGE